MQAGSTPVTAMAPESWKAHGFRGGRSGRENRENDHEKSRKVESERPRMA